MPGGSHGQRSPAGRGLWGRRESDTTEVTATGTKLLETGTKFLPSTGWQYFLNVGLIIWDEINTSPFNNKQNNNKSIIWINAKVTQKNKVRVSQPLKRDVLNQRGKLIHKA